MIWARGILGAPSVVLAPIEAADFAGLMAVLGHEDLAGLVRQAAALAGGPLTDRPRPSSLKHPACGSAVESLPQAGLVSPATRRAPMSTPTIPRGPGLFEITRANGERAVTNVRRLAGAERQPGSVLIGLAAWLLALIGAGALYVSFSAQYAYVFHARHQNIASVIEALLLDLLMIVFTLLALGLARAGKSSRTERALILACAAASAYMNVSAADTASPRSVVAYAVAPIALAVVVDRVVAVIRRHVLADEEGSAWTALGRAVVAAARLAGLSCSTRCGPSSRPVRRLQVCAGWCSTRRRCPVSRRRRSGRRSTRRRPRRRRSWRCTGFTRSTASRPRRPRWRPSWPARRACSRVPPAPTCTPSLRAGRHDRRSILAGRRRPGRVGLSRLRSTVFSPDCVRRMRVADQVPDAPRPGLGYCGELAVRWCRLAALHHGRRARPSLKLRHRLRPCRRASRSASAAASGAGGSTPGNEDERAHLAAKRTGKSGIVADRVITTAARCCRAPAAQTSTTRRPG